MENYMTTKEAAELWGITRRQVQNYCKKRILPGVIRIGSNYLIPKDAIRPVYGMYFPDAEKEKLVLSKEAK